MNRETGGGGSIDRHEGVGWGVFNAEDDDLPLAIFPTEDEALGYLKLVGGGCLDLTVCRLAYRAEVWNDCAASDDGRLLAALEEVES